MASVPGKSSTVAAPLSKGQPGQPVVGVAHMAKTASYMEQKVSTPVEAPTDPLQTTIVDDITVDAGNFLYKAQKLAQQGMKRIPGHMIGAVHRGRNANPAPKIDAQTTAFDKVTRVYTSDSQFYANTTAAAADGLGHSMVCYCNPAGITADTFYPLVMNDGSPSAGVDSGFVFPGYAAEALSLDNVFRRRRMKRMSINVISHALPIGTYAGVTRAQYNVPGAGAGYAVPAISTAPVEPKDTGVVYLAPWSGSIGDVNFNNGALETIDVNDWERKVEVQKFPLQDSVKRHELAVKGFVVEVLQYQQQSPNPAPATYPQIVISAIPAVDTQLFRYSLEQLSCYGFQWLWRHDDLYNLPTGSYFLEMFFEVEFEWSSLRLPEYLVLPTPMAEGCTNMDVNALMKVLKPPVLPEEDPSYQEQIDMLEKERKEKDDKYEKMIKSSEPQSRPNTPVEEIEPPSPTPSEKLKKMKSLAALDLKRQVGYGK